MGAQNLQNLLGTNFKINIESFTKRLKNLYGHWKEHRMTFWGVYWVSSLLWGDKKEFRG